MTGEPTTDQRALMELLRERMDIAYHRGPTGSWAQRWVPSVCKHEQIRCTHGDEIIGRGYRRRVCFVCGRALKGLLPYECFFTGKPHPSHLEEPSDG